MLLNPQILKKNPRDARILESLLHYAINVFQFNPVRLGKLIRQVRRDVTPNTVKLGALPLAIEVITHEVAHMLVDELPNLPDTVNWNRLSYKSSPAHRRNFGGDLDEVHTLSAQTLILRFIAPTKQWSVYRRVLETTLGEKSHQKREHAVEVLLRDRKTRNVVWSFSRYVLDHALSQPDTYPLIEKVRKHAN